MVSFNCFEYLTNNIEYGSAGYIKRAGQGHDPALHIQNKLFLSEDSDYFFG